MTTGDGAAADGPGWLTSGRKRSLAGSLGGALGGAAVFSAGWRATAGIDAGSAQALVMLVPAVVVFGLSLAVALGRFVTRTFDPLGDAATGRYLPVTQRALTNSLEQGIVFLAAGTVLVRAEAAWTPAVAAGLALTFLIARIVFWLGYLRSTFGRAPGMAATMLVNAAGVILAVAAVGLS